MKFFVKITIAIMLILNYSCKKGTDSDIIITTPTGKVAGKVVAANNTTPIKQALVFISTSNKLYTTYTDVNGDFSITAPVGNQNVLIQSGDGSMFRTSVNVVVEENKTTTITKTRLTQVAKLAYVSGDYDKIEDIIINHLGYNAQSLTASQLSSFGILSQFDAVFLNCTASLLVNPTVTTTLANYVANGGSLYVSDWAVAYLIGDDINVTTCPQIRPDGFIKDSLLCTTRTGAIQAKPGCYVVTTSLSTYLGKNKIGLKYDLPNWEQINFVDTSFWEIMVKDSATANPLLIRTNKFTNSTAGTLKVGATNSSYVTVCHNDASGRYTITIPTADLPMHVAHGDKLGCCQSNPNSGIIYYTTFHNENGGIINNDTKDILQYMILNL